MMHSQKVVIPACLRPVIMSEQREYRLSGIVLPHNALQEKDSGQAGMTGLAKPIPTLILSLKGRNLNATNG
jgi:hypothetical protein